MWKIIFLGTGGGRFVTLGQVRMTGGLRFTSEDKEFHVDPGPGALVRMRQLGLDPMRTDAILVSHSHPDHYIDTEMFIEAMTRGMTKKRGVLAASKSILHGYDGEYPYISKYHQSMPEMVYELSKGDEIDIDDVHVRATETWHTDPTGIGFNITVPGCSVGYLSDTEYFDALPAAHKNSRVLILNVLRPGVQRLAGHMCSEDALSVIKEVRPELAIITHFGITMIQENPYYEAKKLADASGVRVVAASDGMVLELGKELKITSGWKNRSDKSQLTLGKWTD